MLSNLTKKYHHAAYGCGAPLFLLLLIVANNCGGKATYFDDAGLPAHGAPLTVTLDYPAEPDPLTDVVTLKLRIQGPEMQEIVATAAKEQKKIEIPSIPQGMQRVLSLEGLDANNQIVSAGQSRPFDFNFNFPKEVKVYFAAKKKFSRLKSTLADGRYDHTSAVLADNRLLIVGGQNAQGPLSSMEIFDPATRAFSKFGSLKTARARHAMVLAGDKIFIVGGEGANTQVLDSVEIYSLDGQLVKEMKLAVARTRATASMIANDKILVVGGRGVDSRAIAAVEIIDLTQDQPVAAVSYQANGIADHAAVNLGLGLVLVTGGVKTEATTNADSALDEAGTYSASTNSWKIATKLSDAKKAVPAGKRLRPTFALLTDKTALLAGGTDEAKVAQKDGLVFTIKDDLTPEVKSKITFAEAHSDHATASMANRVLVGGGASSKLVEVYENDKVSTLASLLQERRNFTLSYLADGSVLAVGGISAATEALNSVELYLP